MKKKIPDIKLKQIIISDEKEYFIRNITRMRKAT
jgi:hypothetical protein